MESKIITNELEKTLFVKAWEDAFARKVDPLVVSWVYNDNNTMYAVFDEDKIVAGYCLYNNKVVYNQNVVDGALCNNVFVHPDYQGLNLFVKLGRYAIEKAALQGKKILIGMPNRISVPGHRRVGWTYFNGINFLEKNIVPSSEVVSNDNIKALNKENYGAYEEKLEKFSIDISSQRSFSVLKARCYFKWRYIERPTVNYKIFLYVQNDTILGYIVYKFYEALNRLHIVDIEASNEEVFNALLRLSEGFEESFSLVNVWALSIYSEYFLKAGFSLNTECSNYLVVIRPDVNDTVVLGDKVNIVLGDNEVF